MMKRCFKCGGDKELSEFYRHPRMADGHLNKCKACNKRDSIDYRSENRASVVEYDRSRNASPQRVELKRGYGVRYPERKLAQQAVFRAVKSGRLRPEPCFICGLEKTEAHHPAYDMPLDVVWLCKSHHRQAHVLAKELGELRRDAC